MAALEKYAAQTVEYAVGFGLGFALGRALAPLGTTLEQTAYAKDPSKALNADTVAALVAEAITVPGGADGEAAQTGIDPARLNALTELALTAPGVPELLAFLRRGTIGDGDFAHGLRKAKLDQRYDGAVHELRDDRLDPAVVAVSVQRGTMHDPGLLPVGPPTATGKVPPMPVSGLDTLKEARDSGMSEDRLAVMTRNVGLPPAPGELLQLLNRGVIEPVDFYRGVAEGNTRNEWGSFLIELKRGLLTPHEYAELRLRGWIADDAMYAGAALHGFEKADTDLLHKLLGRPIPVHQIVTGEARGGAFNGPTGEIPEAFLRSLEEGNQRPEWYSLSYANRYTLPGAFVVRRLLQDGALNEEDGHQLFLEEGWRPDLALKAAKAYAVTTAVKPDAHLSKAETQLWGTIHKSYVDSESDDAEAQAALSAVGVVADTVPKVLALWQHEREIVRRTLTSSEIKKAFKEAKFTRDEALARLERLGLNAADAGTLLDE